MSIPSPSTPGGLMVPMDMDNLHGSNPNLVLKRTWNRKLNAYIETPSEPLCRQRADGFIRGHAAYMVEVIYITSDPEGHPPVYRVCYDKNVVVEYNHSTIFRGCPILGGVKINSTLTF